MYNMSHVTVPIWINNGNDDFKKNNNLIHLVRSSDFLLHVAIAASMGAMVHEKNMIEYTTAIKIKNLSMYYKYYSIGKVNFHYQLLRYESWKTVSF